MSAITVVVPARNAQATIRRTLEALARQDGELDYEVIVVDSGSSDSTPELVERSGIARLLKNPNGEPGGSRNLGAQAGTGSLLAFTDADCEPAPGWLAHGASAMSDADIVQGRVVPEREPGPFDRTVWVSREHGLYETANLFVRREVFDQVGGFEQLVPLGSAQAPFGEDVWFVWRARRMGAKTAFCADAIVRHAVFERRAGSYLAEHARRRLFPALVATIPELRRTFLHHRIFLSAESERFDLALVGLATGLAWRRRAPALLGVAPYLWGIWRARPNGSHINGATVLGAHLMADALTLVCLAIGSIRARTLVL